MNRSVGAAERAQQLSELLSLQQEITVGKDILELLTGAMYVDPLSVYREYVQNAADAIEDAMEAGIYNDVTEGMIHIIIDPQKRCISIRDQGIGLSRRVFFRRLATIGASEKRKRSRRGFRGIGRLSGLGYCRELVFRSRTHQREPVSELRWSVPRMRSLLRDPQFSGSLIDTVRESVALTSHSSDEEPARFFEVQLHGVVRVKNDVLLNEEAVGHYLSQAAPAPFSAALSFSGQIEAHLLSYRAPTRAFSIAIGKANGLVFKPYTDTLLARSSRTDSFSELERIHFDSLEGTNTSAAGWILHHSYFGALPPNRAIGGIRLRKNNMQIGGAGLVAPLFPEPRFNAWVVGEIHVLDPRIVPNGRRDDFEHNTHYDHLQSQLSAFAMRITKRCRQTSAERTRSARAAQSLDDALAALKLLTKLSLTPRVARAVLNSIESRTSSVETHWSVQQQKAVQKLLRSFEAETNKHVGAGMPHLSRDQHLRDRVVAQAASHAIELYGLEKGVKLLEKIFASAR